MKPTVSLVVVAFNMRRELPRTLRSLGPEVQRNVASTDYEVIVVDNGSRDPVALDACRRCLPNIRLVTLPPGNQSPVAAVNRGLDECRGELIGVWIDGARLASPGIVAGAIAARRLHHRPVIGTLGFHLGPDRQDRSIREGYSRDREDALLASVDWPSDGYRLFEISSLAGSSEGGWFMPIAESNAVFMPRGLWQELGGYDPRFRSPGGGLANLDLWRRACLRPETQVVILLGEGTFHQLHGGIATNASQPVYAEFDAEYRRIHGVSYQRPALDPLFIGRIEPSVLPTIAWSAEHAREQDGTGTE